jgi:O-antigen/teichoic acid export membrane protein
VAVEQQRTGRMRMPSMSDMARFVFFCGLTLLAAWIAATGRVAYVFVMLVLAAALGYALLDLLDYEVAKRRRDQ